MYRYSTQEILIGEKGQDKINKSMVAIVGLGALGSLSAQLLARAGVGKLVLIDRDYIELGNLHRQFFDEADVGEPKALVVEKQLKKINSKLRVEAHFNNLDYTNSEQLLGGANLVLDCTDNLETRFLINDFCLKRQVPFVYAAAIAEKGYVYAILPEKERACFECIFKDSKARETCETAGVLNTTTASISVLQVNQAMKILLGKEVEKDLFYFDASGSRFEKIKVHRNPDCAAHAGKFLHLAGEASTSKNKLVKFCGSKSYMMRVSAGFDYKEQKKKLAKAGAVVDLGNAFLFKNATFFRDGRILVKASDEKEALSFFSKYVGD